MEVERAARALLTSLQLPKWAASVLVRAHKPRNELVVWIDERWHGAVPTIRSFEGYSVIVETRPRAENSPP